MKFRHFATGSLIGLALAAASSTTLSAPPVVVVAPPPPLRHEIVPGPRPGHVWVGGHWTWRHGRYVWVSGHWLRQRPGYVYYGPRWLERDGRWHYDRGRWNRGDADRDGIPNRFDRHPNNPYRP